MAVCAPIQIMILFATVSSCLTFNNIPQIDPHDDMAEIQDRQKYERAQMTEHKSNQHADDDIRERYLGWNPLPMQGATVGAPPSKDKVYGIVAEKFNPDQPLLRAGFAGLFKFFCCCTALCSKTILFAGTNRTTVYDHLRSKHDVQKNEESGRGAASATKKSRQNARDEALTTLGPMRLQALLVTRNIIAQFRPFSCVEHWTWLAQAHADHEPCSAQTIRKEVGEWFLAGAECIRNKIAKVISGAHLPLFRLNADLWTSKITKHKYLGVRIFWMAAGIMQTALLACTL